MQNIAFCLERCAAVMGPYIPHVHRATQLCLTAVIVCCKYSDGSTFITVSTWSVLDRWNRLQGLPNAVPQLQEELRQARGERDALEMRLKLLLQTRRAAGDSSVAVEASAAAAQLQYTAGVHIHYLLASGSVHVLSRQDSGNLLQKILCYLWAIHPFLHKILTTLSWHSLRRLL